ncbi:MAG: hypothetical protein QGG22_02320 [Candidatus Thalassarchaeaceae archaeon]|nr:hypothetical protein [Candidatus Thalassarchaeaceae archaeon]
MEEDGGDYLQQRHVKINIIISGWVCIILGSVLLFSSGESSLVLSFAGPISVLGIILLILGLMYKDEVSINPQEILSWEPDKTEMPDSGRVMYRVDTTLIEPIRTSILCGKCGNIYWNEGVKPKSFDCPDCLITLWHEEEE